MLSWAHEGYAGSIPAHPTIRKKIKMSCTYERHKIGDIVIKKPNTGFVSTPGRYIIPDTEGNRNPIEHWIESCDDDKCVEWPDLWEVDEKNQPTGDCAYHVNDCELKLVKNK